MGSELEIQEYFLKRDMWASARLSFQHHVLRHRLGYLVHPDIESALNLQTSSGPIQILDFATGDGVWAIDVATSLPNAQVTGLDISADQFPSMQMCPDNMTLGTLNVLDDVPEKYVGKFDLVHVRFLTPGLFNLGSGEIAVRNLVKMLKRGGWLQWQEVQLPAWGEVKFDKGVAVTTGEMINVAKVMEKYMSLMAHVGWVNELDEMLRRTGEMVNTKLIKPDLKKELLRSESQLILWAWEEAKRGFAQILVKPEHMEELINAVKQQEKNVASGGFLTYMNSIAVGMKG